MSATSTVSIGKSTSGGKLGGGQPVPAFLFVLYCYFLIDFFVHGAARIPGYGQLRPTLLVALVICVALATQAARVREAFQDARLQTMLVLIAYIVISLPLVEWPGSVIRGNYQPFIKAALFLFFTAIIVDTDRRLRIAVWLFLALQLFRSLEPLYLNLTEGYLGSRTHLTGGGFAGRLAGAPADVVNPNGLAFVIATAFAFSHFLLWRGQSKLLKMVYLALLPALGYALILTSSRGGMIAFAVVVFFVLRESRHKAILIVVGTALAIGAWTQMSAVHKDRYMSLVSAESEQHRTVTGRIDGMISELELALDRPIVGFGLGTTSEAKANVYGDRQAAHNLYAQLLIELGIVGTVIFLRYLWLVYRGVRANLSTLRELEKSGRRIATFDYRLNQALLAVFWMYAVYSINYFGLSQDYWYLFGGLCIAFANSLKRNAIAEPNTVGQPHYKPTPRPRNA